jgi:hypothetical protein
MSEEGTIRELLAESAPIVDQLTDVVNTAKKAFVHQRGQLLAQLNNQQDPLCREIRSAISKMSTKNRPYKRTVSPASQHTYPSPDNSRNNLPP